MDFEMEWEVRMDFEMEEDEGDEENGGGRSKWIKTGRGNEIN